MTKTRVECKIGGGVFSYETGQLAKQAAGSCLVQFGETVVLVATANGKGRPGQDFFPLTCDYRERVAAAGKFPGGFLKREGRPTQKEILTARLMDRPIRPLFPEGYFDEVQVMASVLASDRLNDGDILAMNGASLALCLAPVPFGGPIGTVRLALIEDEWVPFPNVEQLEESELDLIVSGSKSAILMIEGFAREMPEEKMAEAIMTAHGYVKELCELQEKVLAELGIEPCEHTPEDDGGLFEQIKGTYYEDLKTALLTVEKLERWEKAGEVKATAKEAILPSLLEKFEDDASLAEGTFSVAWHDLESRVVRDLLLDGKRLDGRATTELRDISCEVDLLPRVHGSALFQRGETQSLVTITLGTGRDEQRVDGLFEEYAQKFMLHYYFPSFSVGECRPIRGPGRREIGHGALAERSVNPVLPDPSHFPYTIRAISDILESNGSSSMASVCGTTLGLMAAGVPITNPVAGISIGLVKEGDDFSLLTDIIGDEDHFGDMDFKVAGTQRGITGIQLDMKCDGITEEIIRGTLTQARDARKEILKTMLGTLSRPRQEISQHAPRLLPTQIHPDKIGMLIGPGGKTIRSIQEKTGASIEVDDSGMVTIASDSSDTARAALDMVQAVTASVEIGRIYDGTVTSIKDFGAFVEILPGKDGLCHISELSESYVSNVNDFCEVGGPLRVKVIAIDDQDRVKLSHKAVLFDEKKDDAGSDEVEETVEENDDE